MEITQVGPLAVVQPWVPLPVEQHVVGVWVCQPCIHIGREYLVFALEAVLLHLVT